MVEDAAPPPIPDAEVEIVCDEAAKHASLQGPFSCDGEPEFVSIEIEETGRRFDMFTYEASHPLATADEAFPCANVRETAAEDPAERMPISFNAPPGGSGACSVPGVRPWYSLRHKDAVSACEDIGWRLCEEAEWLRACQGGGRRAFPMGADLGAGVCNVREAYSMSGSGSEAPTGRFDGCVSDEGAYDLTGNVAEWIEKADDDPRSVYNIGRGWQTSAEFHRDINYHCDESLSAVRGFGATSYATEVVGFRCCRLHVD